MKQLIIKRKHTKSPASARAMADYLIGALKAEFDIAVRWDDNVMFFERPGVAGKLALEEHEIIIDIRLGAVFAALLPSIETAINEFFDAALAPQRTIPVPNAGTGSPTKV